MFLVAGANLFGQWFSDDIIIEGFRAMTKHDNDIKFDLNKAKLVQSNWSYNIYEVDGMFYLAGSWLGVPKQLVSIPMPIDFPRDCTNMLVAGNDRVLSLVDAEKELIFIMDLKFEKKVKKVVLKEEEPQEGETNAKRNRKTSQVVKVLMTNNASIYMWFVNRDVKVYAGFPYPKHFDTSHCHGRVIDVQCGFEHYILLTDTGRVYTWGNGRRLQLGHGNIDNVDVPREVRALAGFNIKKIRAGGWHSAVVSEYGDLYMWGWNDVGQLGIKSRSQRRRELAEGQSAKKKKKTHPISTVVDIYDEELNEVNLDVIDVCCGSKHTIILLSDYSIWATGSNEYGQLGLPTKDYTHVEHYIKVHQGTSESILRCGPWNSVIVN